MCLDYEETVIELTTTHLGQIESAEHLSPKDNYVWRVRSNGVPYIIKIGPKLPYRLRREIRAYEHLRDCGLPIAKAVGSGEIYDIPYLVLTDCGSRTAETVFGVREEPADVGLIGDILSGLLCFSKIEPDPFLYIKGKVTTQDRDLQRLEHARCLPFLEDIHMSLLERIESRITGQYFVLSHRDFSPRQVVLDESIPTLIDFESMGPGLLERDVGDFLGGILKFGAYSNRYGKEVKSFSAAHGLDYKLIADFAVYSLLWSITKHTAIDVSNLRQRMVMELLGTKDWLTNACTGVANQMKT